MKLKTIEEIAFINPDSIKKDCPYDEIEYIDIQSVGSGYLIESKLMPLSEAPSRAKRLIKDGDTILSTVRPNRRSFLYIKGPKSNVVVSTGFAVLRAKDGIDSRYLYYAVTDQKFTDYLTLSAKGAAYPAVDTEIIQRGKIPIYPIDIQQKISSILSAYDDLIENNTRRIKILEEMAQRIYREWFVDFRFPGHEKARFVDSEMGKIPEGWKVKQLSNIVETQYGYTESASEEKIGPKFLRGKDINKNSYINWDDVPYCKIETEDYEKYKLNRGDIVIIRMADPGKVGIVEKDIEAIFASYLIRLKIKNGIDPYYLFYFLLSEQYQSYIVGASTGTTRKSASAGVITDTNILLPYKSILKQFVEVVKPLRQLLNTLLERNVNLRQTRDLLLPKLISGEIDVSELDIAIREQE
ncbi:MAG: restriction endonuclease subunit S [bacterium]